MLFCGLRITSAETKQNNYGLSGQVTWVTSSGGHRNQVTGAEPVRWMDNMFSVDSVRPWVSPSAQLAS
jgi:hypothetical protein